MLSIVQAVALELLWSHLTESPYLLEVTWYSALAWGQVLATFMGIVLIWVVYASNVMRFTRTPVISDLVYPFFIGLVEFMLIANLDPDELGIWFLLFALTFAMMNRVGHTSMKMARQDKDNDFFFADLAPATMKDFYSQIAVVSVMVLVGIYLMLSSNLGVVALILIVAINGLLGYQFYVVAHFWERSMVDTSE
jgi:hypothetical protein